LRTGCRKGCRTASKKKVSGGAGRGKKYNVGRSSKKKTKKKDRDSVRNQKKKTGLKKPNREKKGRTLGKKPDNVLLDVDGKGKNKNVHQLVAGARKQITHLQSGVEIRYRRRGLCGKVRAKG